MRPDGTVTIADVARHAGVSPTTVSYVLNGRDRQISAATRERVLRAVAEVDYRPNALARSLARRRTRTFGLVLAGGSATTFYPIVRGVTAAARAAGYSVLLAAPDNAVDEAAAFAALLEHRVAGIVYVSFSRERDATDLGTLCEHGTPFVVVNRPLPAGDGDGVYWDNRGGARLAAEHLLALGHRRLGFVSRGGRTDTVEAVYAAVRDRLAGFQEVLAAAETPVEGVIVRPERRGAGGALDALRDLLASSSRPTALVCFNDAIAAAALRAAREQRLRVPENLAVVGFDDSELAALSVPSLSSIALPAEAAGRHAVGSLQRRLRQPDAPAVHAVLPCRLVVRESSGASQVPPGHAAPRQSERNGSEHVAAAVAAQL